MMADEEAMRQKKRNRKRQNAVEVAVAPSLSPCPPATPEPRLEYLRPLAGEALSLEVDSAVRGIKREGNQAAVVAPLLEKVEEAEGRQEKKRKRRNRREEAVAPSQSGVAGSPILEGEYKTADVVVPSSVQGKKKQCRVKDQDQSGLSPLPFDVHPQGGENASDVPKSENVTIRSGSSSTMLSIRKIIRMRAEAKRQQPLPQGLLDAIAEAANPSSDSIEQNPNHSSPFGAFFDQFRYIPDRQQNRNPPPITETPHHLARSLPQCHSSTAPPGLNANETPIGAKTTALNVSVSLSQEKVKVDGKKQRKPKPCLRTPDMCSDKYHRLPLDQLVPPPHSPHKLLQEKYASDPWKVIVICILLNLTQGKQVRKKVKGFFKRYPDPQTACCADTEKMVEYLAPLGLQVVKTSRIQQFSKEYVGKEWTHITQLCGVGKYAADAYAIFCAGRATEVVPKDHKLVDYWKYVCFELPSIQGSEKAQESVMTDQLEMVVPKVQDFAVRC